jgi:hypothetical protein
MMEDYRELTLKRLECLTSNELFTLREVLKYETAFAFVTCDSIR